MKSIESFLTEHDITFQTYEHPAVFTCEEGEALGLDFPGADTKNLFLRDKKGEQYFLVVVGHDKRVDLKELRTMLNEPKLSFGSPEKLKEYLGVEPGSVTILGLINDTDCQVKVFLDRPIAEADTVLCHPLRNTATLGIPRAGIEKFFKLTGHTPQVIDVPSRKD